MFRDWDAASRHLRDHLLTAPECHAWILVAPIYCSVLDPADPDGRWHFWEQAQATGGATAQALYDVYRNAAAADSADAHTLEWVHEEEGVAVAVGTSGILLVVEGNTLRTAFLPGQGDPDATCEARAAPSPGRGLIRERGMRSGRATDAHEDWNAREQAAQTRREAAWSENERLYYKVFRPCLQFIKRCHHCHRDMYGRLVRRDYALLKDCLPARNQLKCDAWLALRRRCRGG
jgi:hypothetical protein